MSAASTIDIAALPPNAQKILDPNGPAPLKVMAAKGTVCGFGARSYLLALEAAAAL